MTSMSESLTSNLYDEAFPSLHNPIPDVPFWNASYPDINVCITPEKNLKSCSKSFMHEKKCDGSRKLKVTFDDVVNVQQISPVNNAPTPESSFSICDSEDFDLSFVDVVGPSFIDNSNDDYELLESHIDHSSLHTGLDDHFVSENLMTTPENRKLSLKAAQEDNSLQYLATMDENPILNCKVNSTNTLLKDLEDLQSSKLRKSQIKKLLKKDTKKDAEFIEKAVSKTNVNDQQYSSLVSLEVNKNDILKKASLVLSSKASKLSKEIKPSKSELNLDPPDIMEFSFSIPKRDSPDITLHKLPSLKVTPIVVSSSDLCDIYDRMCMWGNMD